MNRHPEDAWASRHLVSPSLEVGCGSNRTEDVDVAVDRTEPGSAGGFGNQDGQLCDADHQAEMDDLPFPNQHFASLVSRHVIEHHHDTVAVLNEWHRVLRPGGVLVIVAPDQAAYRGSTIHLDPTHYAAFTGPQLAALVTRVGFTVEVVEPVVEEWSFGLVARKDSL